MVPAGQSDATSTKRVEPMGTDEVPEACPNEE
jgi:hypothetical protein